MTGAGADERIEAMPESYDAVVIGGGPGGSTVATAARARGPEGPRPRARKFPALSRGGVAAPLQPPDPRATRASARRSAPPASRRSTARTSGTRRREASARWISRKGSTTSTPWPTRSSARSSTTSSCGTPRSPGRRSGRRPRFRGSSSRERPRSESVAATRGGPEEEIRARVVVDASGQDAFLSRQLGNAEVRHEVEASGSLRPLRGDPLAGGSAPRRHPAADRPRRLVLDHPVLRRDVERRRRLRAGGSRSGRPAGRPRSTTGSTG